MPIAPPSRLVSVGFAAAPQMTLDKLVWTQGPLVTWAQVLIAARRQPIPGPPQPIPEPRPVRTPATNASKLTVLVKASRNAPILIIATAETANVPGFPREPAATTAVARGAATFLKAAPWVVASIVNLTMTVRLKRRARAA
jgi:hypothetical protein